ncbi:unnamed protein product [Ectocarpus sp. 8 AP-2014]
METSLNRYFLGAGLARCRETPNLLSCAQARYNLRPNSQTRRLNQVQDVYWAVLLVQGVPVESNLPRCTPCQRLVAGLRRLRSSHATNFYQTTLRNRPLNDRANITLSIIYILPIRPNHTPTTMHHVRGVK